MRAPTSVAIGLGLLGAVALPVAAYEPPARWERLFYPFPIVGAPPQLEQQVQLFGNYFRGDEGSGFQPSAELAYIATAHWGLVATIPYQIGFDEQPTGRQDSSLLVQYLAAGSIEHDYMLSVGAQSDFPTGAAALTENDYLLGPFAYAAKRFFHRLIVEANATALFPVEHDENARQLLLNGLVSYLTTPLDARYPLYVQTEIDSTRYLNGSQGLPVGATASPAQTVFIAPEIFLGPFKTAVDDGTRIAAGVFFNAQGDPAHLRIYSLTLALDIPNRFGY